MLRLCSFGGLTIEKDGSRLDGIVAQRKVLALLAVLARSGEPGIGRERLMALLWPESDTERARGALKQMLHTLRRQLGNAEVVVGTSELNLNREVLTSDVAEFLDLLRQKETEKAVQLYRGPFLDGVHIERAPEFSRWQDAERAHLQRIYLDALESLARAAESKGKHDEAASWWLRFSASDPLHSRGAMGLIRALDAAGDRAGALRHAQVHETLLLEELGAKPDGDVAALASQLRASSGPVRTMRPPDLPRSADNGVAGDGGGKGNPGAPARRRRMLILVGAITAIMIAAITVVGRDRPKARPRPGERRVVIAMFANQTGDSTLDPLRLLAADWMTRGIARTPLIDVLYPGVLYTDGQSSSGAPTSPLQLAMRNGAQLAVAGNYYLAHDTLFFSASLIDVKSGRVLRVFDPVPAKSSDPLAAIEELRRRTSVALESILDARVTSFISAATPTPRLDAYREFIIGEDLHWHGDMQGALRHFERAGQLDSSFLLVAARMAVTASLVGRCDLVDSIATATAGRLEKVSEIERPTIFSSVGRCNGDWDEVVKQMRIRIQYQPASPLFQYTLAGALRQANRPAEAVAILETVDSKVDLGWLSAPRRIFFWRELAGAQHAIGDYTGEKRSGESLAADDPGQTGAHYFKARSFAAAGNPRAALRMLEVIDSMASHPNTAAGGPPSIRVVSPGWTMYRVAGELLAHGHRAEAITAARRSIAWIAASPDPVRNMPEHLFLRAQALEMIGKYDEANAILTSLARQDSTDIQVRGALGRVAALRGDRATAHLIASSLRHARQPREVRDRTLARAQIAAALGDSSMALTLLESIPYRTHRSDFLLFHSDASLAELFGTARFKAFIRPKG